MKQIRNNVFETNSSSTHSIAISKEPIKKTALPTHIYFKAGEFDWGCGVADPADYLFTAVMMSSDPWRYLREIADTLDKFGIEHTFGEMKFSEYGFDGGYIGHSLAENFVEEIVMNEDRLIRYLCGDTCVYTGNDNCECDDENKKCRLACDKVWDDKDGVIDNPNQDDKHEYYFKGN